MIISYPNPRIEGCQKFHNQKLSDDFGQVAYVGMYLEPCVSIIYHAMNGPRAHGEQAAVDSLHHQRLPTK